MVGMRVLHVVSERVEYVRGHKKAHCGMYHTLLIVGHR